MKVSIITPSYNQAKYLETTIKSVLSQGYEDLEYIIVDGGSTDGSVDIIKKYENRLTWWVSEPDHGQSHAINKGLRKATGNIVAWLNSDDVYAPGAVHSALEVFLTQPETGLVFGDAISVDQNGFPINFQSFTDYRLEDLVSFHIICQPAVFFRKKHLDDVGYLDDGYHFLLDHHLWLRIAQWTEIRHVSQVWAFARYHPEAKNINAAPEFAKEAFQILEWMKTQPELAEIVIKNQEEVMARLSRFAGRYYLDGGESWLALKSYFRSLRISPKIALVEWHRILFAALSMVGLSPIRVLYNRIRKGFRPTSIPGSKIQNIDKFYENVAI